MLHIRLNRPAKRNAISDALIAQIHTAVINLPADVGAILISGEGDHFCAGLDLSELVKRDIGGAVLHSRSWHAAFDALQYGKVPVIAALHGAVVGGLELAAACHIRAWPRRRLLLACRGAARHLRGRWRLGAHPAPDGRLAHDDMMLTGRVYNADEAERYGLVQYLVGEGEALEKGMALAPARRQDRAMTAFAVMHALPRIAEQSPSEGLFTESLMSSIAASTPEAQARLEAFLQGRAEKVVKA